jgi:hypothetical protein
MARPVFEIQETETSPHPNVRLKAQVIQMKLPIFNTTFTWNRPVSASVVLADGTQQSVPVVDVTRLVQVGLLVVAGMAALFSLLVVLWRKSRS